MSQELVPIEDIEKRIFTIRQKSVMLDRDLAEFFAVKTGYLNDAVKRNEARFPEDFRFQLNQQERDQLIAAQSRLDSLKFNPVLPHVYTYAGAYALAFVLRNNRAIQVGLQLARAFERIQQRQLSPPENPQLIDKLDKLSQLYLEFEAKQEALTKENQSIMEEQQKQQESIEKFEKRFEMVAKMLKDIFNKIEQEENKPRKTIIRGFQTKHKTEE